MQTINYNSEPRHPEFAMAVIPEENAADLNALERVVSGLEGRQQDMTPQRRTLGVLVVDFALAMRNRLGGKDRRRA